MVVVVVEVVGEEEEWYNGDVVAAAVVVAVAIVNAITPTTMRGRMRRITGFPMMLIRGYCC